MFYLAKTPKWLIKLSGGSLWELPDTEKNIYLTFDDGPHPAITPFVLGELDKYGAKASFFCIGRNVADNPSIYADILKRGHAVGNHTHNHLNGWKTDAGLYLANIQKAGEYIRSDLFRVIMWSVLSGDFDTDLSPETCCENVIRNARAGSIVVFHDSEKAYDRMRYALPLVLKHFHERGFSFKKIDEKALPNR